MNNKTGKLKAIDFFCGAGGMSYGLSKAGIKIIAGIDNEEQFKDTYTSNIKGAKFISKDITEYHPEELEQDLKIKQNDDNLIFIGCSPCQYWSKVNTDRYSSSFTKNLLSDFQRFVEFFRPGYIIVENVPGIKNKRNNHVLMNFLDFLSFSGYSYKEDIINVLNHGVPQTRRRFLLIATRISETVPYPKTEYYNGALTVRNYIGGGNGFEPINAGHIDQTDFIHSCSRLTQKNIQRLQATQKDGGDRLAWKDNPDLQVKGYKNKDYQFRNVYSRMYWDKPAPTITTRFNSISNGRFGHPEEDRGLSLREGATLQTFPKSFKFKGPFQSIAKQIGNAVPPELAKKIGESILNKVTN